MTKIFNHINTYADLTAYNNDKDKNYPNIAYIQETNEVKWVKEPDYIVAVYNVTSTSSPTYLLSSSTGITYQIIDDVISDTVQTAYTFDTLGEHTVKYKLDGTSIAEYAFQNKISLTSVTIPNSVTSIGGSAFYGCSGLTSVTIPNSVTSIRGHAFYNCSGLTSVTIPDSVFSIGWQAFYNTPWYTNQPDGFVYAGKVAYGYKGTMPENTSITFEDGTLGIADYAFEMCTGLTSVTIPDSVILIGERAFYGCSGLTSVTIGNSVKTIGKNAFYNCRGLTSVTIPDSVILIGERAFYGCSGLTSVTIPDSVISIGKWAFRNCSGLASVSVGNSVTSIGDQAFYNTPWFNNQPDGLVYAGKVAYKYKGTMPSGTSIVLKEETKGIADNAFENCGGLTNITIPNSVTSISDMAFSSCGSLTSIDIPNSITSIGSDAFIACGLTSVTIPNSVTEIGKEAFMSCGYLTSVTIGNSVKTIGKDAFGYNGSLTSVTIQATTPPTLGGDTVFAETNNCPIYVPAESLNTYKQATNWSSLADRIQPIVA